LRRSVPNFQRLALFAVVFAIGLLTSSLLAKGISAIPEGDGPMAALCLIAGWAFGALDVLLLLSAPKLFREWDRDLEREDQDRCVDCDGKLQRPFFRERADGKRFVCAPCARMRGRAAENDGIAARARGAGL